MLEVHDASVVVEQVVRLFTELLAAAIRRDTFLRNAQPTRHVEKQGVCVRLWRPGATVLFTVGALNRAAYRRGLPRCGLHYNKFGTLMCLCPQCRRGTHWQQHHRFVGVLAEESEMKVCLPRLRWQLARGRNASGLRYVRVEQSGEFACFARIVSITAQDVRRA